MKEDPDEGMQWICLESGQVSKVPSKGLSKGTDRTREPLDRTHLAPMSNDSIAIQETKKSVKNPRD